MARQMVGEVQTNVCNALDGLQTLCGIERKSTELQLGTPDNSGGES